MKTSIIWSADTLATDESPASLIGQKALSLHELKSVGAQVPLWGTITGDVFRGVCETDLEMRALLDAQSANVLEKAYALRNHITRMRVDSQYNDIVLEVWRAISVDTTRSVSVRSSAIHEESVALSFAGQMDTFLNITSEKAFLEAVRGCWISLFGDKVVLYSIANGINPWSASVAVVVQQMVSAQVSGVLFTVNPMTGNRKEMLITSTWGLGEGLATGLWEVDNFTVEGHGKIIQREIAVKKLRVDTGQNGATSYVEVDADKQAVASLNDEQILSLHTLASKVHAFKKIPMEIEFAFEGGTLYLLQARPITDLKGEGARQDNFKVWDNSRVIESFSGVTTPLTFSCAKRVYYAYYWQFCEALGVARQTIRSHSYLFENILGLLEGRVYCNLVTLYKVITLIPGFEHKKTLIEAIAGLETVAQLTPAQVPQKPFEKYVIHPLRFLKVLCRMLLTHVVIGDMLHEFAAQTHKVYAQCAASDFDLKTPAELLAIYRRLENEIFWKWEGCVANDNEAMLLYWILKRLNPAWAIDKSDSLHNELLRATGNMVSTRIITELYRIAQMMHADPTLESLFLKASCEEALRIFSSDTRFDLINKEFNKYLEEYGARALDEMKLESAPMDDHPLFCMNVLQNYLRNKVIDPLEAQVREVNVLLKAERELKEILSQKSGLIFLPRYLFYQWVLKNTRAALKNKENQRFILAQAFSLVRSSMNAIGRQWQRKGIIDRAEDIVYLQVDEIQSYIEGTSTCLTLNALIQLRKEEFQRYQSRSPAGTLATHGEVYYQNVFATPEPLRQMSVLKGVGCCRGSVESQVQVISMPDAHSTLKGEIIVAPYLDPAWLVLCPALKGLIVENADMLSYGAIVAREMGIPAVVGVKDATRLLETGDTVLLNATEGTVKILRKVEGAG